MSRSSSQQGRLVALWDVADEAKTHVAFAHAHATKGTHKHDANRSFVTLSAAVAIVKLDEYPDVPVTSASHVASAEVETTLDFVYQRAEAYVAARSFATKHGRGYATRDAALIALCKALDVVTFYRNGPVVREDLPLGEVGT